MAAVAQAAAPAAPIAFTVDTASPASPVIALANHPLITATACLGWEPAPPAPGGAAQVQLPTWAMVKAFGRRMQLSQAPADLATSQQVTPLNLRLTGAAWSKTTNEYIVSGLFAGAPFADCASVVSAIDDLAITTPANLVLVAGELDLGEDTAAAVAVAGVLGAPAIPGRPARGRRGRAGYVAATPAVPAVLAVAAVPGRPALHAALEFLSVTSTLDLETADSSPWALVSYLAGALGACLTQAERNSPAGAALFAARNFTTGVQQRFLGGVAAGPPDAYQVAGNLKDYLLLVESALPRHLLSPDLKSAGQRRDARDANQYIRDAAGRRSVEESRITAYGSLCAARPRPRPAPPRTPAACYSLGGRACPRPPTPSRPVTPSRPHLGHPMAHASTYGGASRLMPCDETLVPSGATARSGWHPCGPRLYLQPHPTGSALRQDPWCLEPTA